MNQTQALDTRASINSYLDAFAGLPAVDETAAMGEYRAEFIGPWWLRRVAPLGTGLVGLRGWCGKRIEGHGRAINRVRRRGRIEDRVPMNAAVQVSRVDGAPALVFTYPDSSPFLLRFFIDELRWYDDHLILAVTIVDLPLLRQIPMPFLLHRI